MIDPENIFHVLPVNDLEEHTETCKFPAIGDIYCDCKCNPKIEVEGDGLLVIHNSFDGREFFEPNHSSILN